MKKTVSRIMNVLFPKDINNIVKSVFRAIKLYITLHNIVKSERMDYFLTTEIITLKEEHSMQNSVSRAIKLRITLKKAANFV